MIDARNGDRCLEGALRAYRQATKRGFARERLDECKRQKQVAHMSDATFLGHLDCLEANLKSRTVSEALAYALLDRAGAGVESLRSPRWRQWHGPEGLAKGPPRLRVRDTGGNLKPIKIEISHSIHGRCGRLAVALITRYLCAWCDWISAPLSLKTTGCMDSSVAASAKPIHLPNHPSSI